MTMEKYYVYKRGKEYWVSCPTLREQSVYSVVQLDCGDWAIKRETWKTDDDDAEIQEDFVEGVNCKSRTGAAIAMGRLLKPLTNEGRLASR